jgi:hypothetical protein
MFTMDSIGQASLNGLDITYMHIARRIRSDDGGLLIIRSGPLNLGGHCLIT